MVSSVGFEVSLESAEAVTDVPVLLEDAPVVVIVSDGGVARVAVEPELNDGDAAGRAASLGISDSLACSRDISVSLACSRRAELRQASDPRVIARDGLKSRNPRVVEPDELG